MGIRFPSVEFFAALQARMREAAERFRRLGYFDTTFGVRVENGADRSFLLAFEVFDCIDVREVEELASDAVDFTLAGSLAAWREMLENIRAHGQADADHSINTLTHFGEKIRVVYDDPDGHDKLYRFVESIQEFFDLAASLEIDYPGAEVRRFASA
ncbi:MAG TPA: hypothetical protein VLF14_10810 [Candidatus Binatia bacterium]|nr:hypothetical protein [Candidatus Binatia bacterium]